MAGRSWWLVPELGISLPLLLLGIDHVLFDGVSLQRIRDLGSQPILFRIFVVVYSGAMEELIYRLFIATLASWLVYLVLSRFTRNPKGPAQWGGIIVAAFLFGLAHVGNLPDVAQPVLRALTLNGLAGLVLGWLYWWHGLELAILTHMLAIVMLYIFVPLFV